MYNYPKTEMRIDFHFQSSTVPRAYKYVKREIIRIGVSNKLLMWCIKNERQRIQAFDTLVAWAPACIFFAKCIFHE